MLTRIGNKVTVGRPLCNVLRIGRPLEGGGSFLRDWTVYGKSEVVGSQVLGVGDIVDQLIKVSDIRETRSANGLTFTNNGDGTFTINGTATADGTLGGTSPIVTTLGHKILSSASNRVYTASEANDQSVVSYHTGDVFNNKLYKPLLLDLTGTPWEDVTSVDEFAQRLGYADASKLPQFAYGKSASLPIAASNRNIWDEVWEVGGINHTDGTNTTSTAVIRSKNYIPVRSGELYYATHPVVNMHFFAHFYDINKNFLSYLDLTYTAFLVPNGAVYMRFNLSTNYGTTYRNDICINLSDALNGTYTPHQSQRFPLVISSPLHGIGDVRDIMRYSDHGITRKYGVVDMGSLTYTYNATSGAMRTPLSGAKKMTVGAVANAIIAGYTSIYTMSGSAANMTFTLNTAAHNADLLYIKNTAYTDATAFKTAMQGVLLVYELATPTFEPVTLPKLPAYRDGTVLYTDTQVHGDTIAGEAPVGFSLLPPDGIDDATDEQ